LKISQRKNAPNGSRLRFGHRAESGSGLHHSMPVEKI